MGQLMEYRHLCSSPETLDALVDMSRESIGFFTAHPSRALEYPWIIDACLSMPAGTAVDLGAGVSPLPIFLAGRGWRVITTDYSDVVRKPSEKAEWDEWGFLDYSFFGAELSSHNCSFSDLPLENESVNVVYSASVIEHMTAALRVKCIEKAGDLLVSGGKVILTIDLRPDTLQLWNKDMGRQVEDDKIHGTINSVMRELEACSIHTVDFQALRNLPYCTPHIGFLIGEKR